MVRSTQAPPRRGRLLAAACLGIVATGLFLAARPATLSAAPDGTSNLRGELSDVVAVTSAATRIPISIVLRDQTPRTLLDAADTIEDIDERREFVITELKQTAASSQRELLAYLRDQQNAGTVGDSIRTLWMSSVVAVDATPAVVREIGAREDVAWVNYNPKRDISLAAPAPAPVAAPAPAPAAGGQRGGSTTCGLDLIRAPEAWSTFNVDGSGVVVAVIDSGVCYNHSDLQNQMWINPGEDLDNDGVLFDPDDMNGIDDDGNGFVDDFIGWDFDSNDNDPNDTFGHGTHCAGTVAGDGSGGLQIGVAPGADIMALRVGISFSDEMDVWNAMQYAADNNADVISMSLGWPHSVGPDRATWRANCDNIASFVKLVIAAGNEGDCCRPVDAVRCPGSVPVVITVGAVDCSDNLASFSSRGPVTWQSVAPYNDHPHPPGLIKPTISAPGVSTDSAGLCSGYVPSSGTSMATPHTAGLVALLLEANPSLSSDLVKTILRTSAVDLGDPGDDNEYGSGRIDAVEALTLGIDPPEPEVTSATPSSGLSITNTSTTLMGAEFYGDLVVRFGGLVSPTAVRIDETTILSSAPASSVLGPVDIQVDTFGGTALLTDGFSYEPQLAVIDTDVRAGDIISFYAGGAHDGHWGLLVDTAPGSRVFKGFTTCLAGSPDFGIIDHSIRNPAMILSPTGIRTFQWEVPATAVPGQKFYVQGVFDGNGPQAGRPLYGKCVELDVVP